MLKDKVYKRGFIAPLPAQWILIFLSLSVNTSCIESVPTPLSLSFEFSSCLGSINSSASCSSRILNSLPREEIGCWVLQSADETQTHRVRMRWDGARFTPSVTMTEESFPFSVGDQVDMALVIFNSPFTAASLCDRVDPNMSCAGLTDCLTRVSRADVTLQTSREISFKDERGNCRNEVPAFVIAQETADEIDNDCDGRVDEMITESCLNGETIPCMSECGPGILAIRRCEQGRFGECVSLSSGVLDECGGGDEDCDGRPDEDCADCVFERCDGLDNDCDGRVDEGVSAPLAIRQDGVCENTLQVCGGPGGWEEPSYSSLDFYTETEGDCDTLDNDCDGEADEACICKPEETCNGQDSDCNGLVDDGCVCGPSGEICDGIDNDCDGATDEELTPVLTGLQDGVCEGSFKVCKGVERWKEEYQDITGYQQVESVCDGLDNDCDGAVDEDFMRESTTRAQGACLGLKKTCKGDLGLVDDYTNVANFEDVETICDGIDNDCDGVVDEAVVMPEESPLQGVCRALPLVCNGEERWGNPDFRVLPDYQERESRCDGLDNDCDGVVDEEVEPPVASLTQGVCEGQVRDCDGVNQWVEPDYQEIPDYQEVESQCDGLDNDCDGSIDEGVMAPVNSLNTGVCLDHPKICQGDERWADPVFQDIPNYEADEASCDGLDNDCDGIVDESCPVCIPSTEVCDGVDNDCDGSIDEGAVCAQLIYNRCAVSLAWAEISGNPTVDPWESIPPDGEGACSFGQNEDEDNYSCDTSSSATNQQGFRVINIGSDSIGKDDWLAIAWRCEATPAGITEAERSVIQWVDEHCHVALAYQNNGSQEGITALTPSMCPTHVNESSFGGSDARCVITASGGRYSALEMENTVDHDDWFGVAFYCDRASSPIDPARDWSQIVSSIQLGFAIYLVSHQDEDTESPSEEAREDGVESWSVPLNSEEVDNSGPNRGARSPASGSFGAFKLNGDNNNELDRSSQFGIRARQVFR